MATRVELAVVSERVRSWLNGNPERLTYERLIGKRVKVIPESEFAAKGRCAGKVFVMVQPLEGRRVKSLPICKDLLDPIADPIKLGNERRARRKTEQSH